MKIKIITFVIMLIIIINSYAALADTKNNDSLEDNPDNENFVEIRLARHSAMGSSYSIFDYIFDDYQWMVGDKIYKINMSLLTDYDIFRGELTTENYDLLIMPFSEAIIELARFFYPSVRGKIWKTKIKEFIEDGGGFIGYCAPTFLAADLEGKPDTLLEKMVDNFDLGISNVKIVFDGGFPFLSQLSGKPEKIGPMAYYWYSRMYVPLDVTVDRSNPIFNDFLEDKRRISWCSGPAFELPEFDENISALAYYPSEEISDNKSTQIHAWRYTGGIRGLIKGFFRSRGVGNLIVPKLFYFAGDWEPTDKIIQTNYSNKPFMIMETYPNENQGRIILSGGHPESQVCWGGEFKEMEDTRYNILFDGLNFYTNMTSWDDTPQDEFTYNWWIVRRHVAWTSKKVPDCDLPPVYGSSQVVDLEVYNQSSCFTIQGNIELSAPFSLYYLHCLSPSNVSLDLYYRYSMDNSSCWSNWMLYKKDDDISDGWLWEFNASELNGTGFYQFYSIKQVEFYCENEMYRIIETAPPGPDAIAYVKIE